MTSLSRARVRALVTAAALAVVGVGLPVLAASPALAAASNDEITSPTALSVPAGTTSFAVTNAGGTHHDGDPVFYNGSGDGSDSDSTPCYGMASVWYRLNAASLGRVTLTLSGVSAGYDADFAVFKARSSTASYTNIDQVEPAYPVASLRVGNTDTNTSVSTQFDVTSGGGAYFVALAGCAPEQEADTDPGVTGTATLTAALTPRPANDPFSGTSTLAASQSVDLRGAVSTHETNEPNSYGIDNNVCNGSAGVWYGVTPGVGRLHLTTSGETFDGVLTVMHGSPTATLNQLTVDRDPRFGGTNGHADVVVDTVADQRYWVRVEACNPDPARSIIPLSELGTTTLASTFTAAPANDAFATPTALTGASGTVDSDTSGATGETGETAATTTTGSDVMKSVWFSWTIPTTGSYVVTTDGAAFNTVLGVGSRQTAINAFYYDIASNDNLSVGNVASRVKFTATAGKKLLIRVSGVDDGTHPSAGAFTLTYGPSPDDVAPTATIVSPAAGARVPQRSPLVVKVKASDDKSGVAKVNVSVSGYPSVDVTTPTDGYYVAQFNITGAAHNSRLTISAYSVDEATNHSATATRTVTVDDGRIPSGYTGSTKGVVAAAKAAGVTGAKGAKKTKTAWTSTKKGATITVHFVGNQLDLYLLASATSGKATLTLDGVRTTVDLGSKKTKDLLKRFSGMSAVEHTLVITNTGAKGKGSKGTVVQLDKLRVYDPT